MQILEKANIQTRTEGGDTISKTVHVTTREDVTQTSTGRPFVNRKECWVCGDPKHWPSQSAVFKKKSVDERKRLLKKRCACFKCHTPGHLIRNCKSSF